jgi:hypothetical protein
MVGGHNHVFPDGAVALGRLRVLMPGFSSHARFADGGLAKDLTRFAHRFND